MEPIIKHFKDHYIICWPDGTTTECDTHEEAEQEIKEAEGE